MSNNKPSLEKRIERLEQYVEVLLEKLENLERLIESKTISSPAQRPVRPLPPAEEMRSFGNGKHPSPKSANRQEPRPASSTKENAKKSDRKGRPMYSLNSDEWLNRIGLGLLFLGMGLGLRYTFEEPWFTALPRVMSGSFVGLLFIAIGLHFSSARPRFGQLLLSSGVATFYITAFGAYQLYHLIPYSLAFVTLFIITALSLSLAAHRDDVLLAVLATLGGLVTPFIMHSEGDNLLWLITYTSLILIGSSAMYWFRGWRSLLLISSAGAWLVILFCYLYYGFQYASISSERWTLQIGLLVALVLFWIMPVVRGMLRSANPDKWPAPPPAKVVGYFFNHPALPLSVSTPLLTLILSTFVWNLSDEMWGWISVFAGAVFLFIYLLIRMRDQEGKLNHLAQMQGFTGILLITIGLFYLLDSYHFFFAITVQAFLIRFIAVYMNARLFSFTTHAYLLSSIVWVTWRLIEEPAVLPPFFSPAALFELTTILLIGFASFTVLKTWLAGFYQVATHLLLLAFAFREFYTLEDGQAVITTIWGIYSIGLLLYGIWRDTKPVRYIALYTLTLVAVKLLLVDLEEVEPLIRILLFVGFGIIFMLLSYLLSNFLKRDRAKQPTSLDYAHKEAKTVASK